MRNVLLAAAAAVAVTTSARAFEELRVVVSPEPAIDAAWLSPEEYSAMAQEPAPLPKPRPRNTREKQRRR